MGACGSTTKKPQTTTKEFDNIVTQKAPVKAPVNRTATSTATPAKVTKADVKFSAELVFYLNTRKVVVKDAQPQETLISYLRRSGLTGTKLGCGEGGCGACTVMVQQKNFGTGKIENRSVNACLAPLCSCSIVCRHYHVCVHFR